MKTQKELTQLLTKKVEEISLAKDKAMGFRNPMSKVQSGYNEMMDIAIFKDDKKAKELITKIAVAHSDLTKYLDKTYQW